MSWKRHLFRGDFHKSSDETNRQLYNQHVLHFAMCGAFSQLGRLFEGTDGFFLSSPRALCRVSFVKTRLQLLAGGFQACLALWLATSSACGGGTRRGRQAGRQPLRRQST